MLYFRCSQTGDSQCKFDDQIIFTSLTDGNDIGLINGSITTESSRPFKEDSVYAIGRSPGLGLKFRVVELN